jgi:pilus assembly protein CpaC
MLSGRRGAASQVRVVTALLLLVAVVLAAGPAFAKKELILRVGESKTIYLGKIQNVDVGNPGVIDVQRKGSDKIVVFGVTEGYSSLVVGDIPYDVNVVGDVENLRRDIKNLLLDIPGVDVLTSGTKVVIDGVVKRRDDFERIFTLVEANEKEMYSLVILDERDIVRRAQVQMHFQVLEVNKNRNHDIGIDWSSGPVRVVMDTMSWVQFGPGEAGRQSLIVGGSVDETFGRFPDDYIDLKSSVDIRRILDKDFFTTVSGETVEFQRGKELIFIAQGGGNDSGGGNVSRFLTKNVGLEVEALPVIDDDGDIDLKIEIKFSTVGEAEFLGSVPAINTQSHKAHVQLREGESFALSGFFQRARGRVITGLPGLKDIPGLGVLFGSRAWQSGETDGIIVLTPVLLDPDRRSMRKQIKETLDVYDSADVKW